MVCDGIASDFLKGRFALASSVACYSCCDSFIQARSAWQGCDFQKPVLLRTKPKMDLRRFCLFIGCFVLPTLLVVGSTDVELQTITSKEWKEAVNGNKKLLVVFYKESSCTACQETVDLVASLVGDAELDTDLLLGKSSDSMLAADLEIPAFPAVIFLRESTHVIFDGKPTVESLFEWLELSRTKAVQFLHDDSFEHLTQASTGATTGDWLVAFYQEKCKSVLSVLDSVGVRIRHKTNVAAVDSSKNEVLADRFSIKNCPEIILFKQGKMYRYEIPKIDQSSLKSFVDAWHKNSKAETVLPPKSKFDYLTESIADFIKSQLEGKNRNYIIGGVSAVVGLFTILFILCCCRSGGKKKVD